MTMVKHNLDRSRIISLINELLLTHSVLLYKSPEQQPLQ